MKTLVLSLAFFASSISIFSQARLVKLDTLCEEYGLRQIDSRRLCDGRVLLHMRCKSNLFTVSDYFVIRDAKRQFFLINQGATAMGKSCFFSPDDMPLKYVYIDDKDTRWKYEALSDSWLNCGKPLDHKMSMDEPRE